MKHLATEVHLETKQNALLICSFCNKKFKTRAGLWKHKNKCREKNKSDDLKTENTDIQDKNLGKTNHVEMSDDDMFKNIEKENNELRNMIKTLFNQNNTLMDRMSEQNQTIKDMVPKIGNKITTTHQNLNIQIF